MLRLHIADKLAKNAAVIGALVTAIVAVAQLARGVSQTVREFEWKQAEEGRALVRTMLTDDGWDAMTMLDFVEGRTYEIAPDAKVVITPSEVVVALEGATAERPPTRTDTQRFIIDRYDRLFFLVSQLQVAIRSGLVRKDDVSFPLSWYVEKRLCRHKQLLLDYMNENTALRSTRGRAARLARLEEWTRIGRRRTDFARKNPWVMTNLGPRILLRSGCQPSISARPRPAASHRGPMPARHRRRFPSVLV